MMIDIIYIYIYIYIDRNIYVCIYIYMFIEIYIVYMEHHAEMTAVMFCLYSEHILIRC